MSTPIPHVLRAEGVNFRATLDDTDDISTIRGAGLALLDLYQAVEQGLRDAGVAEPARIFAGASQCAYAFNATPDAAEAARQSVIRSLTRRDAGADKGEMAPFHHLSFVVDVAPGDRQAGARTAEARNRARQFREWTVVAPDFAPGVADSHARDRLRPATTVIDLPDEPRAKLSASTAARFLYGRTARQHFYRRQFTDDRGPDPATPANPAAGLRFVDSFQDMVAQPPPGLRPSLQNAIAVVYADGNGFGRIRDTVGAERFATELEARRKGLLRAILTWLSEGQAAAGQAFSFHDRDGPRLRFETLLWGGDEFVFVMPAWLALGFTRGFLDLSRNWAIDGIALTHTVGVVTCHCKTPIRLARATAHQIADAIKEAPGPTPRPNALAVESFEGVMPPLDSLSAFRRRLYGDGDPLRSALCGNDATAVFSRLRDMAAGEVLARSQVHAILHDASRQAGGLVGRAADDLVRQRIADHVRRVSGRPVEQVIEALHLPPPAGAPERGLAMNLALHARLWDYVDPLGDGTTIPPMEQAAA